MLGSRGAFVLSPFRIGHERHPGCGFDVFVRPFEQIDEFRALCRPGFPHRGDVKSVPPHDAGRVVAKARMEERLVLVEDFVDAQLVYHAALAEICHDVRAI